jgi:hypothetical protein
MFRHNAQLQDLRDLLMARARSGDRVGLSKLADRLIMDAEYVTLTSEEESDDEEESDEAPTHSIKRKTSSGASCSKREKRPRLVTKEI